jgi:acyl dehydratase
MSILDLPYQVFPSVTQTYSERDAMLYAMGLAIGQNPIDPLQLQFVQEEGLRCIPTFGAVLATPASWMWHVDAGIDWRQLVALSHDVECLSELPTSGTVISQVCIKNVFDRGAGRGALIHWERELKDAVSGRLLCRTQACALARGDGGFGGSRAPTRSEASARPTRVSDLQWVWSTSPSQALLYRLSGDMNPLHSRPAIARSAGFERPILHGLCMLGMAAFGCIALCCEGDPKRLRTIGARYAGVFYPGETLVTEFWLDGSRSWFRCISAERETVVLEGESICAPG